MNTKKLIIVCDTNHKEQADFMVELTKLQDDTKERIIGCEDGSVSAEVWFEKDYITRKNNIPENAHILFLGNLKSSEEYKNKVSIRFNKHKMIYGWCGKYGILYVDSKKLSKSEYKEFIDFCAEQNEIIDKTHAKFVRNSAVAVGIIGLFFSPIVWIPAAFTGMLASSVLSSKIRKQQYTCLIRQWYFNALAEFME